MLNPIGQKVATGSIRGKGTLLRQLTRLADFFDKHHRPSCPIHLPCSQETLSRLGLQPGHEPGTYRFRDHLVMGCWK